MPLARGDWPRLLPSALKMPIEVSEIPLRRKKRLPKIPTASLKVYKLLVCQSIMKLRDFIRQLLKLAVINPHTMLLPGNCRMACERFPIKINNIKIINISSRTLLHGQEKSGHSL